MAIVKNGKGFGEVKFSHVLMFVLGASCIAAYGSYETRMNSIGQVMILIIYLGTLINVAPVEIPKFKSKFLLTTFVSIISMWLDSFPVLDQAKKIQIKCKRTGELVNGMSDEKTKLYTLWTLGALSCGLCIWFGEGYAAGLYNNDSRTGILSALFIVPPVMVFVTILSFHSTRLQVEIVVNGVGKSKGDKFLEYMKDNLRELIIFGIGIATLLITHNPLLCLGIMLIVAVITRKTEEVIDIVKNRIEIDIILVLLIALLIGPSMIQFVGNAGLGHGTWRPIIPSTFQAVLWGALYEDSSVHFWIRMTNLSTGAMLTPISSLVGILLIRTKRQWMIYMRYSIPYCILWYCLMRGWIYIALESPAGEFMEQFAHSGGH